MRRILIALASGALFGAGLAISGMMNPARVLGFLDLAAIPTGGWDPTLAFVMGGALLPMAIAWRLYRSPGVAADPGAVHPDTMPRRIDGRLTGGAVLFGLGWGLVGLCPGPALAGLGLAIPEVWGFTAAMILGMGLYGLLLAPGRRKAATAA